MTLKLGVGVLCVLLLAVGVLIGMEIRGNDVHAAEGHYQMDVHDGTAGMWVVLDTQTGATSYHSVAGGHAQEFSRK